MLSLNVFDFLLLQQSSPFRIGPGLVEPTAPMKAYLALGNNFIPPQSASPCDIATCGSVFMRRLRLYLWSESKSMGAKRSYALPQFTNPNFEPEIEPSTRVFLTSWNESLITGLVNSLKRRSSRSSLFVTSIRSQLRRLWSNGELCRVTGDKGYGPTLVHPSVLKRAYASLASDTVAFKPISLRTLAQSWFDLSEHLSMRLDNLVANGLLSNSSKLVMMSRFCDLNLTGQITSEKLVIVGRTVARCRFLVKLHKPLYPQLQLRRIEADLTSPLKDVARWLGKVLLSVERKLGASTLSSHSVVADLTCDPIDAECRSSLFLVSADIVNYFEKIRVEPLKASLSKALDLTFGTTLAHSLHIVKQLISIVLSYKYVLIDHKPHQKLQSLSIGEYIATSAANIHRWLTFDSYLQRYRDSGLLLRDYGYVDDGLFIFQATRAQVDDFVIGLGLVEPTQFSWTASVSGSETHFLDLTIRKKRSFASNGLFDFAVYAKPYFRPQYTHWLSQHPAHMRRGLFHGLLHRYLVLSSSCEAYYKRACETRVILLSRGYPTAVLTIAPYDTAKRAKYLKRTFDTKPGVYSLDGQNEPCTVSVPVARILRLTLPFVPEIDLSIVRTHFRILKNLCTRLGVATPRFQTVWKLQPNIFRLDYSLNGPHRFATDVAR
jgi:hypothetical protein